MFQQLDQCKWLFLREISEPEDNSLRLLVEEARTGDIAEDITISGVTLQGLRKVEHDDSCRVFEVTWETYICYSVVNESYASVAKTGTYTGQSVRQYSESPFLEYIRSATFASADYPGPFQHVSVLCGNHIVEVASTVAPCVRLVKAGRLRAV
jgi:hypothetical protein